MSPLTALYLWSSTTVLKENNRQAEAFEIQAFRQSTRQ
jgi:hypothetical protein